MQVNDQRVTAAANAVDRVFGSHWQQFLDLLRTPRLIYQEVFDRAFVILNGLLPAAAKTLDGHLRTIQRLGYNEAARHTVQEVPIERLAEVILDRLRNGSRVHAGVGLRESVLFEAESPGLIQLALDAAQKLTAIDATEPLRPRPSPVQTAVNVDDVALAVRRIGERNHGLVDLLHLRTAFAQLSRQELDALLVQGALQRKLTFSPYERGATSAGITKQQQAAQIKVGGEQLGYVSVRTDFPGRLVPSLPVPSDSEARDLFAKLLFPPPTEQETRTILFRTLHGQTWYQALDCNARRAEFGPRNLARTIATGYSLGQTQAEIAQSVFPFVYGTQYRAKRTARTFGLAIAQATQQHAHEQLGNLVIGYQVHALLDTHTRPAHRERHLRIYYIEPEGGQHGMDECPQPPLEADGSLAWNCRCTLSPVLRPPG